jgi:aminoglycoside phosphotransferase (APT) family kinase protein
MVEYLPDHPRDRELMLAEALAQVPGYRPGDPAVETARLSGGSVNRSYSVFTPAGRFVMRLSPRTDAWLTTDRSVERELHQIASAAGLAPRIVHADSRDRWLITEYIDGRLWSAADFANPACMARLGRTLRTLHALPAPLCGRFDLLAALDGYVQRIAAGAYAADGPPPATDAPRDGRLAQYLEDARRAWHLSGAAERPAVILHHDLYGSNLIEGAHGLLLIDWECAAVCDPLLDIACILSYYDAAAALAPILLRESGLQEITRPQLAAAVWLFDLHTYLWYRERRQRLSPTAAELEAEQRLSLRLERRP